MESYELSDIAPDILLSLPILDPLSLCRSSHQLSQICKDSVFWAKYFTSSSRNRITEAQEKYHDTMVDLAKNGEIGLFLKLWNEDDIIFIKERRTLEDSFRAATEMNIVNRAAIWNLDSDWLGRSIWWNRGAGTIGKMKVKEYEIWLEQAARNGDKLSYINLIYKLMAETDSKDMSKIVLFVAPTLGYSPDANFAIFGMAVLHMAVTDSLAYVLVLKSAGIIGNLELIFQIGKIVRNIQTQPRMVATNSYYRLAIESRHLNEEEIMLIKREDTAIRLNDVNPNIFTGSPSKIGTGSILLEYAKNYPESFGVIMMSWQALPADEFVDLLKRLYICIPRFLSDGEYISILEYNGYEYLAYLIEKNMDFCDGRGAVLR